MENNIKDIKKNKQENALEVKNLSKVFKIPHRKIDSMKGVFVNALRKKTYEEFKALDNVSFSVKKGEFVGIIGHNGAGKSTLLKILAEVYQPSSGEIKVNGMIAPFLELGIGFNPELSGRDNIYLNATVLGLTKEQIDGKFDKIVEFSELERFIDQQVKNYSSGMRSRLAFSVSIHAQRDILLMDEVLAVGDSSFKEKCLDVFKGYKDSGKTVILVTHGMATVREYCNRAILIDGGIILKEGDVEEVCDEYVVKTIQDDNKNKSGKNIEIKEAENNEKQKDNEILEVKVLNNKENEIFRIFREEKIIIRTMINVKDVNINDFIAVQLVDRKTDCVISGNNTKIDEFEHDWRKGRNKIDLVLKNIFFNRGDIYLRIFLKRRIGEEEITIDEYKSSEHRKYIKLIPKYEGMGSVYINHNWRHN